MDHYLSNYRSMAITAEVAQGTLSSRFDTFETSLLREPGVLHSSGTDRQVYEKHSFKEKAEGSRSNACIEHDCRADGSRSSPHFERSH